MTFLRRLPKSTVSLLLSSFLGGTVAVGFLVQALGTCATQWVSWVPALTIGTWSNVILHLAVLWSVALMACIAVSWFVRQAPRGSWLALISAFSFGAATWLLPAAMIVESAFHLGGDECTITSFRPIFLFECAIACAGLLSLILLTVMTVRAAWIRSRRMRETP